MWAAGQPRPTLAAGFAVGQAGRRTTTFNDVHWGISGPEIPFNTFMPTLLTDMHKGISGPRDPLRPSLASALTVRYVTSLVTYLLIATVRVLRYVVRCSTVWFWLQSLGKKDQL